jgi:hypothetical protein
VANGDCQKKRDPGGGKTARLASCSVYALVGPALGDVTRFSAQPIAKVAR